MSEQAYCPVPMQDGSDCWRPPEPDGFAGICTEHMHKIAKVWIGDVPMIERARCEKCGLLALIVDRLTRITICAECDHVIRLVTPDVETRNLGTREPNPAYPVDFTRPRTDVVYYIRFGDRVKIGTTSNLPKRLAQLPYDELLAIEPGPASKEHARHAQFRAHLIPGQREWFTAAPAIVDHAAALMAKYGPPLASWQRWARRAAA